MSRPAARCGTLNGYQRHVNHREPTCGPCRSANNDYKRAQHLRKRRDYRISIAEAYAELGLPPDRIPQEATP